MPEPSFPGKGKAERTENFRRDQRRKHTAVSTRATYCFISVQNRWGYVLSFASIIDEKLQGVVEPVDETHGFRYMDRQKPLSALLDGTENPAVDENPYHFAVVGEVRMLILQEEVMFLYRSTFTIWLHGTPYLWKNREKVIGRRKFNDVELSDEEKPQNA